MKTLADMTFEYIWLMTFGPEDQIDTDYSVQLQESLSLRLQDMSEAEMAALSAAAQRTKEYLLAEPDEYGFTPRATVTQEQKDMLEAFISGDVFRESL